jgi:hypothetical protein
VFERCSRLPDAMGRRARVRTQEAPYPNKQLPLRARTRPCPSAFAPGHAFGTSAT